MHLFLWVIVIVMNVISSGTISVYNSAYILQCQTVFRHSLWCKKQNALCGNDIHPSIHWFIHLPIWPCVSIWTVCHICLILGIVVLYKKLSSRHEFCKNQQEIHVVCKGINEYLSIVSTFLDQFSGSQYRISPHNAVQHLSVSEKLIHWKPYFT